MTNENGREIRRSMPESSLSLQLLKTLSLLQFQQFNSLEVYNMFNLRGLCNF